MPRRWPCSARASWRSGPRCSGQEAAQVGSARALRPDDFVFTSYREHGVAYCRGVDPGGDAAHCGGAPASRAGTPPPTASPRRPSSSAPRRCTRRATRSASCSTAPRSAVAGLLRRRRDERGRRRRGPRLRGELHGPGRLLLPEQPVGDLRAGAPAVARLHRAAGAGLRHPRDPGRRQRRAGRPGRHPSGARPGLRRPGPDAHRGRDLPHGAAHHVGRPDALPLPPEEEEWRAKDPLARLGALLHREGLADDGFESERRRCGRRRGRGALRRAASPWATPSRPRCSSMSTPSRTRCSRRSARLRGYLAELRRGRRDGRPCRWARRSTPGCAGPWSATPRSS